MAAEAGTRPHAARTARRGYSAALDTTIPDDLSYLLTTDILAHAAALRPDGSIAAYLMWVDYDGERVLISSRIGSRKGRNWRRNPQAALTVVDRSDPWRFIIIRGRVTDIRPDEGLAFIDKLSMRYTGSAYRMRDFEREIFTITPDHVKASRGRG
jgi:PPOX class probable F420-dependent enzyme